MSALEPRPGDANRNRAHFGDAVDARGRRTAPQDRLRAVDVVVLAPLHRDSGKVATRVSNGQELVDFATILHPDGPRARGRMGVTGQTSMVVGGTSADGPAMNTLPKADFERLVAAADGNLARAEGQVGALRMSHVLGDEARPGVYAAIAVTADLESRPPLGTDGTASEWSEAGPPADAEPSEEVVAMLRGEALLASLGPSALSARSRDGASVVERAYAHEAASVSGEQRGLEELDRARAREQGFQIDRFGDGYEVFSHSDPYGLPVAQVGGGTALKEWLGRAADADLEARNVESGQVGVVKGLEGIAEEVRSAAVAERMRRRPELKGVRVGGTPAQRAMRERLDGGRDQSDGQALESGG